MQPPRFLFYTVILSLFFYTAAWAKEATIKENTWIDLTKKVIPAIVMIHAEVVEPENNNASAHKTDITNLPARIDPLAKIPLQSLVISRKEWDNYFGYLIHTLKIGTGSVIHPDGFIITNYHIIEGTTRIKVIFSDDTEYEATLVSANKHHDAALLKIKTDQPIIFSYLPVASASQIERGQWFLSIGHPHGLPFGTLMNVVNAPPPEDNLSPEPDPALIFRLSSVLPPGLSGAPIVTLKGQAIGMVFAAIGNTYFPGLGLALEPIIKYFRDIGALPKP